MNWPLLQHYGDDFAVTWARVYNVGNETAESHKRQELVEQYSEFAT